MLAFELGTLFKLFCQVFLNAKAMECVTAIVEPNVLGVFRELACVIAFIVEACPLLDDEGTSACGAHYFLFPFALSDLFVQEPVAHVALPIPEQDASALSETAIGKRHEVLFLSTIICISDDNMLVAGLRENGLDQNA